MTARGNEHVWHRYVVEVDDRDRVLVALAAAGITAGVHHAVPIHLHRAYRWLGQRAGSFPVAEAAAARVLSLPLFPGITLGEQERVAKALRRAVT
jgi:dTDP-4-amino-4,6-dideoxygalactose transaminase